MTSTAARSPGLIARARQTAAWWAASATAPFRAGAEEKSLNQLLHGYPRNHDYLLAGGRMTPSPRLYKRWAHVASLYPERLTSLLDVGCARGYFVLEAARRPTCEKAVGIDVHEPFVETSRKVAAYTGQKNAAFHVATLDQFANDAGMNTGPYQTILLLNVYHYLFAGSDLSPLAFKGHGAILDLLKGLCSDRVIFSSPLELDECPNQVREHAEKHGIAGQYTRAEFLRQAGERFAVEDHGLWGRRPLLVLKRR